MVRCYLSLFCPGISRDRLTQLVEWCDRYSPLVARDGDDGVIFDLTGCTHLFGGEDRLLLDLQQRLHRLGIESHAAIADAWAIAWALARYGERSIVHGAGAIGAVDALPVDALRLPAGILQELRRLGLTTIAAVRKIPRRSLAARFGSTLLRRLDLVSYHAEEPLTPWRPPATYRASRILADPVSTAGDVEYVLRHLLREVCPQLEKDHLGARRVELACYRVDGTVDRCEARTSKPVRSIPHLLRLFGERLDGLRAAFGFEIFALSVLDLEALAPAQMGLSQANSVDEEASFDALVDRLGMRLGFEAVNRVRICESFIPEHSVELRPAAAVAVATADWPAYRLRPVRLLDPPMKIEVSVLIPGESPVQFFIGPRKYRIVRSEGPERLTAEWWREPDCRWGMRDYYQIEDERGFRFWIFRDPEEHWYLHGHLG